MKYLINIGGKMKLSTWAKKQGISYKTAWRLWSTGKLPLPAEQLATGTIIVKDPETSYEGGPSSVVLYVRVSSSDQKQDLDRQLSRLVEYTTSKGLQVKGAIKEIGSGLNGKRTKLLSILSNELYEKKPYQTILDPPPADPSCAHPPQ